MLLKELRSYFHFIVSLFTLYTDRLLDVQLALILAKDLG